MHLLREAGAWVPEAHTRGTLRPLGVLQVTVDVIRPPIQVTGNNYEFRTSMTISSVLARQVNRVQRVRNGAPAGQLVGGALPEKDHCTSRGRQYRGRPSLICRLGNTASISKRPFSSICPPPHPPQGSHTSYQSNHVCLEIQSITWWALHVSAKEEIHFGMHMTGPCTTIT
jgi:hypothetical protein